MRSPTETMHLVAMVNPPTSQYAENWRYPLSRQDWLSADFYTDLARTLERGCFDMVFFPDALAIPEDGEGSYVTTVHTGGKGTIYLDPLVTLSLVAGATTHLGLGATVSTTFTPAYTIARKILSLDHLSGGRAAWNIVTSTTDTEARNFGLDAIPGKEERYRHADQVVQTVLELWDSWEPGALVLDGLNRQFADPTRVNRIARSGDDPPLSRGPLTLPRSPQGRPVLMQAGSSARGMDFAARWAEIVFAVADNKESMRSLRMELRDRASTLGRDPDGLLVLPAVQPIVGSTKAAAQDKLVDMEEALDNTETLAKLGRLLHAAPEDLNPERPAVELLQAHRGVTGSNGFEDMLLAAARREEMTVQQLATHQATSQLHPQSVDDPEGIADYLCDLFESEAADGFVIMSALYPTSIHDFVNAVVPELQQRKRFRRDYPSQRLRDRLR